MQRPLQSLPAPTVRPQVDDPVEAIYTSGEFGHAQEYFRDYPPFSLLHNAPVGRAFIYLLIRVLGLHNALEIGTYRAGTSEIIARAIWANGGGHLDTVDPYGVPMIHAALNEWDSALRALCTYHQANSMEFFGQAVLDGKQYDFAFVDGDHDYEVALFDIQRSATLLKQSSILLIDNADLPAVRSAALRFLAENPEWTLLGRDGERAASQPAIVAHNNALMSVPGTEFWCLRAPSRTRIGLTDRVVVFPNARFAGDALYGLRLRLPVGTEWPPNGIIRFASS